MHSANHPIGTQLWARERETGRRTMSHNSAGRLPYDSIVACSRPCLDDAPNDDACLFHSSGFHPPRVCLHVSAPPERNSSSSSCKRLQHYRTRGYRGLHDACVGRVEGSLFPLACACRGTWVSCPPYSATRSRVTPRLFLRRISALDRGEDRRERCGVEKGCGKYALNFGFERKRSEDRFIRFMEIEIPLSFSRNFNNNKTFFFPRRGGRECFFVKRRFLNKYRRGRRSADVGASSCFDIRVRD